jgi:hypothetical protein
LTTSSKKHIKRPQKKRITSTWRREDGRKEKILWHITGAMAQPIRILMGNCCGYTNNY